MGLFLLSSYDEVCLLARVCSFPLLINYTPMNLTKNKIKKLIMHPLSSMGLTKLNSDNHDHNTETMETNCNTNLEIFEHYVFGK